MLSAILIRAWQDKTVYYEWELQVEGLHGYMRV